MLKRYILGFLLLFTLGVLQVNAQSNTSFVKSVNEVKIFPNPSYSGQVELKTTSPIIQIQIINALGELVVNDLLDAKKELNGYIYNDLPVDAYVVIINTTKGRIYKKLIVLK